MRGPVDGLRGAHRVRRVLHGARDPGGHRLRARAGRGRRRGLRADRDGTYLMQPTELVTAAQEGLKVITVVVDNAGHQCIRGLQVQMTDVELGTQLRAREAGTGRLTGRIVEVDFVANARSLGCLAARGHARGVRAGDRGRARRRRAVGPHQ